MTTFRHLLVLGVLSLVVVGTNVHAQQPNLLTNSGANEGLTGWQVFGAATTATLLDAGGNRVFVIRGGARLIQRVDLAPDAAGQYLVYIARAMGDRLDRPGDITDQPYLYGLMYAAAGPRILSHHQAPTMGSRQLVPGQWGRLWGIFRVPPGAGSVTFQMSQGSRRGTPRDGSAARFDDVGLFLFADRAEADAFIRTQGQRVE